MKTKNIIAFAISAILFITLFASCASAPREPVLSNTDKSARLEKTADIKLKAGDTDDTIRRSGETETTEPSEPAVNKPQESTAGEMPTALPAEIGGDIPDNTQPTDGFYSGVLLEGRFYHDGRNEWLPYYYADIGKAQYDILNSELGGIEDSGQSVETEIQVYTTDESIRLKDRVGQRIVFKGEFFEANTIYHRRGIVFEIKELGLKQAP